MFISCLLAHLVAVANASFLTEGESAVVLHIAQRKAKLLRQDLIMLARILFGSADALSRALATTPSLNAAQLTEATSAVLSEAS